VELLRRRFGDQRLMLAFADEQARALGQAGSGTPSDLPGAMRGPSTSSEKLPLPRTATRKLSGKLSQEVQRHDHRMIDREFLR
jgi:hypothetical protein